jgi:CBS domain-containing protein
MQRLVRIRLTHRRDGDTDTRASVFCPSHAASRTLDECLDCPARIGFKDDPDDAWVMCTREPSGEDDGPVAVAHAMTRTVRCVRSDVEIGALESLLLAHAIGGAPVLDEHDRLIGVASLRDVANHRRAGGASEAHVVEIASEPPITIGEHEPIARAAARMAFEHVHRLPVIDEHGAVVGILTALDLVRWTAREEGFVL